jgi:hypothetical protein
MMLGVELKAKLGKDQQNPRGQFVQGEQGRLV